MTYVWQPSPDYLETSNVVRLMHRLGVGSVDDLRAKSVSDIAGFWASVIDDLGITFTAPPERILDLSNGIEWPEWFVGGRLNAANACLGRWAGLTPDGLAVVHEDEAGNVDRLTFAELDDRVARVRSGLRDLGVVKGDAVAVYLPMGPEAVIATYAVASIGAMLVPLFSGFSASAIASRLQDAAAVAVVTADGTMRRGRETAMLPGLRTAVGSCPSVRSTIVVHNLEGALDLAPGEVSWDSLLGLAPDPSVEDTSASDVLLLAYTSGTTGKPKGAVHTHAGFVVKTASELAYGFEIAPGRTLCWITDMGWIMGPLSIFGTHANGGTLLLYEGSPDTPDAHRVWQVIERHGVTTIGVSPTLIRTLRAAASTAPTSNLSSVRIVGSTGEPWDPESYEWLARDLLGSRVPIINFSGGTEVGGSFLCPYPVEPIASCSLGGPALGMDVDVVDGEGRQLRDEIGELVCRQPWPSMTRGVWQDRERYLDAYWRDIPGMWRHGDFARADTDGGWYILGRSDDVMNVAGKRVAPAEIEAVVTADPDVTEAAVVGVPDTTKGEAIWVFYVPHPDTTTDVDTIAERLKMVVADEVGKPFRPSRVVQVAELPKTRSAKILRRAIRAAVLGIDPGDLSGAENPEAVDQIRARVAGTTQPSDS